MPQLPIALEREPLLDAIFEVRMNAGSSLAEILPGALFSRSPEKPTVTRLSAADLPQPIRAQDPNLKFAPLIKIEFATHAVSVSDGSYIVGCKLPYPKWPSFKQILLDVTDQVSASGISGEIERFSLKYINLIEAGSLYEQLSKVQIDIKVGSQKIDANIMHLRTELPENGILHVISIMNGATANFPDRADITGVVVDIDSIRLARFSSLIDFSTALPDEIEKLRQANKRQFFACLTADAIEEMGPTYE